jgi:hypothetical protein
LKHPGAGCRTGASDYRRRPGEPSSHRLRDLGAGSQRNHLGRRPTPAEAFLFIQSM